MLAAWLAGVGCRAGGGAGAAQPRLATDDFFGVRLGTSLAAQLPECPTAPDGTYREFASTAGPTTCWKRGASWHDLLLPRAQVMRLGVRIDRFEAKEVAGRIEEVRLECTKEDWKRLEAELLARYGRPSETERYERDSRVLGRSTNVGHTWRGPHATVFFLELTGGEETSAHAVLTDLP